MPAIAHGLSPNVSALLQFDRTAVAAGQLWRVVTCHWTHWSFDHLLWDVAAFAALAFACFLRCPRRLAWTIGLASVAIPAAVWIMISGMQTYRGLSGLASALAVLLVVDVMQTARGTPGAWTCRVLLIGFAVKLGYEALTGTTVFVHAGAAGFVPVPLAHAVGGAVGGLVAVRQ